MHLFIPLVCGLSSFAFTLAAFHFAFKRFSRTWRGYWNGLAAVAAFNLGTEITALRFVPARYPDIHNGSAIGLGVAMLYFMVHRTFSALR